MAKILEATANTGSTEELQVMLASQVSKWLKDGNTDCIVIVIPDTGKSEFNGSHEYTVKSGAKKGEQAMSKARFVIAKTTGFYGDAIKLTQDNGDVAGLPLTLDFELRATPPNADGATVVDALKTPAVLAAELKAANDAADAEFDAAKAAKANGQGQVLNA